METLLLRVTLADQVAALLQRQIAEGRWNVWLPNERALCAMLGVSRNTLRAALADLTSRGMVKPCYPRGTIIVAATRAKPRREPTGTFGLLSPLPIDQLRPNVTLIIDALRAQLAEVGGRLHLHHGECYGKPQPERSLDKLVAGHRHDCWLLVLANDSVKRWFCRRGLPCVVSGSCAPDVPLPFVDLDYRALGRHAAGRMLGIGHRRIAMLIEHSSVTGKLDCERGFREGAALARRSEVSVRVHRHRGTLASVRSSLDQALAGVAPPTALFVVDPNHFLLALTYLQSRGVRVPDELSLVCSDDDPFLSFVHPAPSRYRFDAGAFAQRLFKLIDRVSQGQAVIRKEVRIIPRYEPGATLAAPKGAGMVQ